ncbi:tyrosine-type recombinase/integrase [Microbacter margulisiae]|uniref:Site-specific recombinase XerD n=1 Tax=Microbacter margulisiae TaxID=1350067 RepID=A0A7W5DSJ3_9PORP|nr:tyrosine-type recombinase/integrase [Microbacter margulisiae]MBB3188290.1 site-specific recombinase XerD [Microbacter margulisiae]
MSPNKSFENLLIREMQIRNYSPRTIDTYCKLLCNLEKEFGKLLYEITTEDFKSKLHFMITQKGASVSTVNQLISAFKIFYVAVCHREWEEFRVKRPRTEKKLPIVLSLEEVGRMISVTNNLKHKAILMLTYSAGLRRMEVLQIKPKDIDSQRMQVHVVQGKGKKDRYTILSQKTLETLREYYKAERPTKFLFEPAGHKGQPLWERSMEHIVKNSAKKAGIKKDVSFHTLRHCFATHLLEAGVNLRQIQQFMGHTSFKTTAVYLHVAHIKTNEFTSPLDKINLY